MLKKIETERLVLRGWRESDASDLFEFSRSDNMLMAGAKIHKDINESLECICSYMNSQETWAIALKENNKVIGWIGLYNTNRHGRYRETEYVISEHYQNRGFATEAVKALLGYAFGELDLMVVAACHYPHNVQSKRVIEKCGFTYEGTLRKYSKNLYDSVRYSMLKVEWETLRIE